MNIFDMVGFWGDKKVSAKDLFNLCGFTYEEQALLDVSLQDTSIFQVSVPQAEIGGRVDLSFTIVAMQGGKQVASFSGMARDMILNYKGRSMLLSQLITKGK